MDTNPYLDIFLEEAREHLQALNQNLLAIESGDNQPRLIEEIFRSAHTLKGMAATMGFTQVTEITHRMEDVFSNIRSGKQKVTPELTDLLFRSLDALDALINQIGGSKAEGTGQDFSALLAELKSAAEGKLTDSSVPPSASAQTPSASLYTFNSYEENIFRQSAKQGFTPYLVEVQLMPDCLLKSVRAFMVFRAVEKLGEVVKTWPDVKEIEDEQFADRFTLAIITQSDAETVKDSILSISEISGVKIEPITLSAPAAATQENKPAAIQEDRESEDHEVQARKLKTGKTVRVDIERLDNLMNLVSELVINRTRLEEIGKQFHNSELTETVEQIDRITADLQNVVMKVRMVPIEQVFNRFPRMVRDLSKELGKEITLVIEGKETELDRTVIDEIGDPLVHLIRNSIDHGIEEPAERLRLGKPSAGRISLKAYQDGNNVVIEVEDDGRGLPFEKIKNKALQQGLITAAEAAKMEERELVNLIFHAGFSTADKISDISGRGVGLDVVRNKIEYLGGNIEVETVAGKGTTFSVRLPLTLAIIQALLVKVGGAQYAIPLSSIQETTAIPAGQITNIGKQEVVLYRNSVLPIVRLQKVLETVQLDTAEELFVVVVKKGERLAGLVVDDLVGQQDIVIKSLGKLLCGIRGFAGATILGDGQVALILDTSAFF